MARQRTVRPQYFMNEDLYLLGEESGVGIYLSRGFEGLWCYADCMGNFEWRPLRLKQLILPWYSVDFAKILEVLERGGFVRAYTGADGKRYGWVVSWPKFAKIHPSEWDDGPQFPQPTFDDYKSWKPTPKKKKDTTRTRSNKSPERRRTRSKTPHTLSSSSSSPT